MLLNDEMTHLPTRRRRMSPRHLQSLIAAGHYKPEPALIAEAMLQRRGVRLLLGSDSGAPSATGRTRSVLSGRHREA